MITVRVSYSMDPDQARHLAKPDLVPNCLLRSSADGTSRERVTGLLHFLRRRASADEFMEEKWFPENPTF